MISRGRRFSQIDAACLYSFILAIAMTAPHMAYAEAGPQDRGYFAMRLPDAAIANLSGQMQPVILPLEDGYYRYGEGAYGAQHAQGAYSNHPHNPPHAPAISENRIAAPEWGAYDDWGGWQEYVGR